MEKKRKIIENVTHEEKEKILQNFVPFLTQGKFVNIGTCNLERMPNVAPKPVLHIKDDTIFLIDYVMGRTYTNLSKNPRASLSFMDESTLTGYQLSGPVTILENGEEFRELSEEFQKIKTDLLVERILLNVRAGRKSTAPQQTLPERFAVLKFKVLEIVEIASSGVLRSKLSI
ncbi:MAG: pyridoxamine 5'-phosphate oxidase family protein [Candidatus Omnitrophota bacterium]